MWSVRVGGVIAHETVLVQGRVHTEDEAVVGTARPVDPGTGSEQP
jgi:hypothetical protein